VSDHKKKSQYSAKWKIQNVVVSVELKRKLDLKQITEAYKDAEKNMNRFPGICLRLTKPKCAILMFSNGKMIITGLKYTKDAQVVVDKVIERLKHIEIEVKEKPKMEIVNIVISLALSNKYINLDEASLSLMHSIYEPEVFPGLIYRVYEPFKAVFLIFSSGKIVLTGIKAEKNIESAIVHIGKTLKELGLLEEQNQIE
jgi:transcription initiation factor TFIID TATA-box-binding protein